MGSTTSNTFRDSKMPLLTIIGALLDTLCTQCSYCVGQADTAAACAAGCSRCPCDSQVDSSCAFCESGESFNACTKRCTGGCNICKGRDGNGLKICKNRG